MSLLTIIMPVYNAEDTLPAAIEGILRQSYRNLEVLLVDDGSAAGVEELVCKLTDGDQRFQVITQRHAGSGAARNAALQMASGRYVYFADADDVMAPEAARIMVNRMENPGTDLLTFGYRQINRKSGAVKEFSAGEGRFSGEKIRSDYTSWTTESGCKVLGSCWNKCFRMDIIKEYGVVFPNLQRNEEEIFIMNYIEHVQDVYNIPDVLYNFYPIDLEQAWKRLPDDFCEEVEQFRRKRLEFAVQWNCDTPKTREFIAREYWGKMMLGLRLCFNPEKMASYGEFKRRCAMMVDGLKDTGHIPAAVTNSSFYKLLNSGMTPIVWFLVRRNSKG